MQFAFDKLPNGRWSVSGKTGCFQLAVEKPSSGGRVKCRAKEDLEEIESGAIGGQKHQEQAYGRLLALFERPHKPGQSLSTEYGLKNEGDVGGYTIYGIRGSAQIRIVCTIVDGVILITHVFQKKGWRWPKTEFTRARRILDSDNERMASRG